MKRVLARPTDPKSLVPIPGGGNLPPEGRVVAQNSYWLRRQRFGEVTLEPAPEPKKASSKKASAEAGAEG